jgi:hypothetical protein
MKSIESILMFVVVVALILFGFFVGKAIYHSDAQHTTESITVVDTVYVQTVVVSQPQNIEAPAHVVEIDSVSMHHIARIDTVLTTDKTQTDLSVTYRTQEKRFSLQWETTHAIDSVYVYKTVENTIYVDKPAKHTSKNVLPIIGVSTYLADETKPQYSVSVGLRFWNKIDALLGTSTDTKLILGFGYRF